MKKYLLSYGLIVLLCGQSTNLIASEFKFDENYLYDAKLEPSAQTRVQSQAVPSTFKLIVKNSETKMYADLTSANIIIENLKTNYRWFAAPLKLQGKLNEAWQAQIKSPFLIEYTKDAKTIEQASMFDEMSSFKVSQIANGIEYQLSFLEGKIKLTANVTLVNNKLQVEIPKKQIKDSEQAKLLSISVLPFWGASYLDQIDGDIITSFDNGMKTKFRGANQKINKSFSGTYAQDLSFNQNKEMQNNLRMPLFGLIHGEQQNAVAVYAVEGYNDVQNIVYPAGNYTDYNTSFFKYQYRYQYTQKLSEEKNLQKISEPVMGNVKQEYSFLANENANFVGIGKAYKQVLKFPKQNYSYKPEIQVLGIGGRPGLIGDQNYPLTTYSELTKLVQTFGKAGINADYTYQLLQDGTYFNTYNLTKPAKSLGTEKEFNELLATVQQQKANLSMELVMWETSETSNAITGSENFIRYPQGEYNTDFYGNRRLSINALKSETSDIINYCKKNGIEHISVAFPSFSTDVKKPEERLQQTQIIEEFIAELAKEKITVSSVFEPDITALENTKKITSNLKSEGVAVLEQEIPLLSSVISGSKPIVSEPLNYMTFDRNLSLKLIEYNIYPTVSVADAEITDFKNSYMDYAATSRYEIVKTDIEELDKFVKPAFSATAGSAMTNYEILEKNVVKITYENDAVIYINYNMNKVEVDGQQLEAQNFKVVI
ncbi:MAG: DUF5696 domain-containing protein [Mycoplasmatales bacterium]